jgi:hypothetical protein
MTFVAHVANRPTLLETMGVHLSILTGLKLNADGTINVAASAPASYMAELHPDGSVAFRHESTVVASSLSAGYSAGVATFQIDSAEFGSPASIMFQFNVFDSVEHAASGSQSQDSAPTSPAGQAPYTLQEVATTTTTITTGGVARSGNTCGGSCGFTHVSNKCVGLDVSTKFTFRAPDSSSMSAEWRFTYYGARDHVLRRRPAHGFYGPVGVGADRSITKIHLEAVAGVKQVLVTVTDSNAEGDQALTWHKRTTC